MLPFFGQKFSKKIHPYPLPFIKKHRLGGRLVAFVFLRLKSFDQVKYSVCLQVDRGRITKQKTFLPWSKGVTKIHRSS